MSETLKYFSMKLKTLFTFLLIFCFSCLFAQNSDPDFFRSTGKIYVVVAVLLIIFFGIIFFLVRLDRKISRLESLNR